MRLKLSKHGPVLWTSDLILTKSIKVSEFVGRPLKEIDNDLKDLNQYGLISLYEFLSSLTGTNKTSNVVRAISLLWDVAALRYLEGLKNQGEQQQKGGQS